MSREEKYKLETEKTVGNRIYHKENHKLKVYVLEQTDAKVYRGTLTVMPDHKHNCFWLVDIDIADGHTGAGFGTGLLQQAPLFFNDFRIFVEEETFCNPISYDEFPGIMPKFLQHQVTKGVISSTALSTIKPQQNIHYERSNNEIHAYDDKHEKLATLEIASDSKNNFHWLANLFVNDTDGDLGSHNVGRVLLQAALATFTHFKIYEKEPSIYFYPEDDQPFYYHLQNFLVECIADGIINSTHCSAITPQADVDEDESKGISISSTSDATPAPIPTITHHNEASSAPLEMKETTLQESSKSSTSQASTPTADSVGSLLAKMGVTRSPQPKTRLPVEATITTSLPTLP